MLTYLPNVSLRGIRPETLWAIMRIENDNKSPSYPHYITSITNGKHGYGSKHYTGEAFDYDIVGINDKSEIEEEHHNLQSLLGPEFDVVIEWKADGTFSHFHIEYHPKHPILIRG